MAERIKTLHPQGKEGVNIEKTKYTAVRQAILDVLAAHDTFLFRDLPAAVEEKLDSRFDGSVGWYTTTVKLDLEARGEIERISRTAPQALRLTGKGEAGG